MQMAPAGTCVADSRRLEPEVAGLTSTLPKIGKIEGERDGARVAQARQQPTGRRAAGELSWWQVRGPTMPRRDAVAYPFAQAAVQ